MSMMERRKRLMARVDLIGPDAVNVQDARPDADTAKGAVKRVGEYKRRALDPADGTNDLINRRSTEYLK